MPDKIIFSGYVTSLEWATYALFDTTLTKQSVIKHKKIMFIGITNLNGQFVDQTFTFVVIIFKFIFNNGLAFEMIISIRK